MCNKCKPQATPQRHVHATREAIDYTQPMSQFTVFVGANTGTAYLLESDATRYDYVWGFSRVRRVWEPERNPTNVGNRREPNYN